MSDIFNEVDEEVRREQLKKLWERYSNLIIGVAILVVAAVGAWRGYEFWQARKAAEAGAAYEAALKLSEDGKHTEAEEAFGKLAAQGTSGYRMLARVRQAAELGAVDPKAGIAAYDAIAGEPGPQLIRDVNPPRSCWWTRQSTTDRQASSRLPSFAAPPHRPESAALGPATATLRRHANGPRPPPPIPKRRPVCALGSKC